MTPAYETMNYLGIIKEKTLFFKIGPFFKKQKTLCDTGSCDELVIYWFFGEIRFFIFNYKGSDIKNT